MLGANVQLFASLNSPLLFTRIFRIENIANVDFDRADDGSRRLQRRIARHVRRPRFLDARVFLVGELSRDARGGDRRGEDRNQQIRQQASDDLIRRPARNTQTGS